MRKLSFTFFIVVSMTALFSCGSNSRSGESNNRFVLLDDTEEATDQRAPSESISIVKKNRDLPEGEFYIKFGDKESFNLPDGSQVNASLTSVGLGDLTFNLSWYGDSPVVLEWSFDGRGMEPLSGTQYAKKNYGDYSVREHVFFSWTDSSPEVYGIFFTITPITEEERKFGR